MKNTIRINHIYIVLLLFILLIMLGILGILYRYYILRETSSNKQIIVIDKITTEEKSIPVYPTSPPKYSNNNTPHDYQQMGILTSHETDKEPVILPLFGRKIHGRSDRYQYYTATDKYNMMRLPLNIENRDCEDTVGCRELYTGDTLEISIYKDRIFTATIYKPESPRYFASSY